MLLLLIAALIQIPIVQQYLTGSLENYLENKFETEVNIESLRLKLPESLSLGGVYVEDLKQDTFLNVGELIVNFKLTRLLSKQIQFDEVTLNNGRANLYFGKDSSNLDFILNAFDGNQPQPNIPKSNESEPWVITFDNAGLSIKEIDFQFSDEEGGINLQTHIGKLNGQVEKIDYLKNQYLVNNLQLENSTVQLEIFASNSSNTEDTTQISNYNIQANDLILENVVFDLNMPDLEIKSKIGKLKSTDGTFNMNGKNMQFEIPHFQVAETDFNYDRPYPTLANGFDYNHFGFQKVNIQISDFKYDNLDFLANIIHISGKNADGFELKNLQTNLIFSPESITFENLNLKTKNSNFNSPKTKLGYPFLSEENIPIEQLKTEANLKVEFKNLDDLSYFYPPLDSISFFQNTSKSSVKFNTNLSGSLEKMTIHSFNFVGFETELNTSGKIQNLTNIDRLRLDLNINQFETTQKILTAQIPKNTLPQFVQLPDHFALTGKINGTLQDFKSKIKAISTRQNAPFPTKIKANINFRNITNWDSAFLDIQLDTLHTSKVDLMAYIPPDAFPDYIDLPEQFMLTGSVKGITSDLQSDLHLLTYRAETSNQFDAVGSISGLFTSDSPIFNISVNAASLSQEDLKAFLPDSLFPAYFQLPIINKLSGILKGDLDNFSTNFALQSNTGDWAVNAVLNKEKYQLDLDVNALEPGSFFTENYLDSLAGFKVLPLSAEIQLEGQGFDFSDDSFMDLIFKVKNAANPEMEGLVMTSKLENQKLTATAIAQEKEINLQSNFSLDYTNPIPEWKTDLQLKHLDLAELGFSDVPFLINGNFKAEAKGYSLDTLSGSVLVSDFNIQYSDQFEKIDSLNILANLDNGENLIQISSDFFNAQLNGWFEYPSVVNTLEQQISNYFDTDFPDTLIGKTNDYFDFEFNLFRPEILTMGYIPTLVDLSPFDLTANFDNQKSKLNFQTTLPYFDWQNMDFDGFSIQAKGDEKALGYTIDFEKANILDIAEIQKSSTFGTIENQQLQNTFLSFDEKLEKRFELKSALNFLKNQAIELTLFSEQLLNYEKWSVTKDNSITLLDEELSVKNWRFFKEKESFEILDLGEKQFQFSFKNFDLKLISDIIKFNENYVDGILSGDFSIQNPFKKPLFNSNLTIKKLGIFGANLGDLNLNLKSQSENLINAQANLEGNGNNLSLIGNYNLENKLNPFNFRLNIPALNLSTIEPLTFGYLEKMKGVLVGDLKIEGSINQPSTLGQIQFKETEFNVEMLNTRLKLGSQSVIFDANAIEFRDLEIFDANDNKGIVSSYILTENYRDFFLQSNIKVEDFQILDTKAKDNDLYYGKLLVDADVNLTGKLTEPIIEITAKPKEDSDLTYIYSATSNQLELHDGIVEFVIPEEKKKRKPKNEQLIEVSDDLNMKIIVKIEVNEDLNFKAITDPLTGDFFEGKAKGDLVYIQQPDGTMELNGSLEVVEGKYLFTYQNVIRRPFEVKSGGTLSWTGDPFNPKLDINVIYKVRASSYPLIASGTDTEGANTSLKQTFLVNLNIGGTPTKTDIKTSLEYPNEEGNTNDSAIQAAIDQINQDKSRQNTQAFALILFNGFLSQNLENSNFQVVNLSGNINNVISQQLNGLANRYIKFVELDFGLDTYENSANNSQTDFRVSVRKRFLNDRLTISLDGKTTTETGYEESTSQTYLDNVTIEYALTPDGRFKVKVYNKRDFDDFIGGTAVKIGGALVFSKEFDGIQFKKKK